MPVCEMASHVIFFVLNGEATVTVTLKEKQCLITEPSTLSMKTTSGVRIMGVQIAKATELL